MSSQRGFPAREPSPAAHARPTKSAIPREPKVSFSMVRTLHCSSPARCGLGQPPIRAFGITPDAEGRNPDNHRLAEGEHLDLPKGKHLRLDVFNAEHRESAEPARPRLARLDQLIRRSRPLQ